MLNSNKFRSRCWEIGAARLGAVTVLKRHGPYFPHMIVDIQSSFRSIHWQTAADITAVQCVELQQAC